LEDIVSLAETRSFSRSAQLRHVTQPAFSRRIPSLEAWAGVALVDRTRYPTRLTEAGQTLYAQAIELLQTLHTTRALLRQHTAVATDTIEFAVPHTLAFTYFPSSLSRLRTVLGPIKTRLVALNVHDAVLRLTEGRLRPAAGRSPRLPAHRARRHPLPDVGKVSRHPPVSGARGAAQGGCAAVLGRRVALGRQLAGETAGFFPSAGMANACKIRVTDHHCERTAA